MTPYMLILSKFGKSTTLVVRSMDDDSGGEVNFQKFLDYLVCGKDFDVNVPSLAMELGRLNGFSKISCECTSDELKLREEKPVSNIAINEMFKHIGERLNRIIYPGSVCDVKMYNNYGASKVLVVHVKGFRYCLNVNKEHKKNNIYFVYKVESFDLYQRCYDPMCYGFRSRNLN